MFSFSTLRKTDRGKVNNIIAFLKKGYRKNKKVKRKSNKATSNFKEPVSKTFGATSNFPEHGSNTLESTSRFLECGSNTLASTSGFSELLAGTSLAVLYVMYVLILRLWCRPILVLLLPASLFVDRGEGLPYITGKHCLFVTGVQFS